METQETFILIGAVLIVLTFVGAAMVGFYPLPPVLPRGQPAPVTNILPDRSGLVYGGKVRWDHRKTFFLSATRGRETRARAGRDARTRCTATSGARRAVTTCQAGFWLAFTRIFTLLRQFDTWLPA